MLPAAVEFSFSVSSHDGVAMTRYVAQYLLTQDQVYAVARGALTMIDKLNGIQ